MTSLSGHSGGTTATITNIIRRKSNPRQPRTQYQSEARARLGYLSQLWGALTHTQQDAWIAAAPNYLVTKDGVSTPLKGNTAFIRANTNLLIAEQEIITTPPAPIAFPNIGNIGGEAYYSLGGEIYQYDTGGDAFTDATDFTIIGLGSPFFPAGISDDTAPKIGGKRSIAGTIRELGIVSNDSGFIDLTTVWPVRFPNPAIPAEVVAANFIGSVVLGFKIISNTSGQASQNYTKRVMFSIID